MENEKIAYLESLEKKEDYLALIKAVKDIITEDKTALIHPFIKKWCGKRFRNLFLQDAVNDPVALKSATADFFGIKKDQRSDRQKIAERYIKGDEMREWKIEMPKAVCPSSFKTTLVFAPGLLTGMLPVRAFQTPFPIVEKKLNIRILRADLHPMRGCKENLADLKKAIDKGIGFTSDVKPIAEADAVPPKDFFLIGYSKGAPDILNFLVTYPEYKDRIRCIFNWGGAVGGSYLADDIYNSIKNVEMPLMESVINNWLIKMFPLINEKGLLRRFDEFDIKTAMWDLTTMAREAFLEENLTKIADMNLPFFNITGSTTVLNVPYFQVQGVLALNKYDANNDMQITQSQGKLQIPMATDLAMWNAHHWDMSYDPFPLMMRFGSPNLDHPFPKEAAPTAMIQLVGELGLID